MKKRHIAEEIVVKLREAKVLVENWGKHYNRLRPHSSLGYRAPAPEAMEPVVADRGRNCNTRDSTSERHR